MYPALGFYMHAIVFTGIMHTLWQQSTIDSTQTSVRLQRFRVSWKIWQCRLTVPPHFFERLVEMSNISHETKFAFHYNDVIMNAMASQITSLKIAYSTVYAGADQRKQQSSASMAFVRGIHRWPVNYPYKGSVTRNRFPFHDVIIYRLGFCFPEPKWRHQCAWLPWLDVNYANEDNTSGI